MKLAESNEETKQALFKNYKTSVCLVKSEF